MIMLWIFLALLTGLAVFSLLWPLARLPAAASARDKAATFYRGQIEEIGRDRARGLLDEADAEAAAVEAGRRLLRSADGAAPAFTASATKTRVVAVGALAGIPALALGLYLAIGSPDLPDRPLEARLVADPAHLDLAAAVARIEERLAAHPDDGRGFEVVAPVYLRLGRAADAIHARQEALRLLGPTAEREALLGEALVLADGGTVGPAARAAFTAAAALDSKDPASRFYLGLAAAQAGDAVGARAAWTALLADAPPGAAFTPIVQARLAALADAATPTMPAPSAAAGAAIAALPADAQRQAIRGMVDGLAQRLAGAGNDPEGWLRLVRAYKVLDERGKALDALRDARRNLANDPAALARLSTLAHELELEG